MKFIIYKDKKGEWRWRLRARNGRIIADSGEGYKRKKSAEDMIHRILTMEEEVTDPDLKSTKN